MLLAGIITVAITHVTVQITSGATRVDRRAQLQTEAALAMTRLRTELEQATTIVSLTTSKVTFQHPDVTGDSKLDKVTYEWSGTIGDPLTRQVNANTAEPVMTECQDFTLAITAPPLYLEAGKRYPLKLEYYEKDGSASCALMWSATGVAKQVIPQAQLFPAYYALTDPAPSASGIGLTGRYFSDQSLTTLVTDRTDSTVDMSWGTGSPISGVGTNNFSIRWTGQVSPSTTGNYTFYLNSDDGVRLWVNNALVIDNWTDHTAASECKGKTSGVTRIDVHLEAGEGANAATLDGAVRPLNAPGQEG